MAALSDAIAFLEREDWEAAHAIAQDDSSSLGSWAHGIVHMMEGDLANASYWYRQAGREFPSPPDIAGEIAALKERLGEE